MSARPSWSRVCRAAPVRATGVLAACALVLSGCGRFVTISGPAATSAPPPPPGASAPPSAPASSAPPETPPSESAPPPPSVDDNKVQVVDGSAKKNGQDGDGGTVIGTQTQEEPPKWVQLSAVESGQLDGSYLINVKQAALYRFDKDDADPSRSNCEGDCAQTWPPVTIKDGGNIYLAGVDKKQVGAIRRQDGDIQLTVGGWPVYRFAKDQKPGDLKGEGVGGTWFAVGPDGSKVKD